MDRETRDEITKLRKEMNREQKRHTREVATLREIITHLHAKAVGHESLHVGTALVLKLLDRRTRRADDDELFRFFFLEPSGKVRPYPESIPAEDRPVALVSALDREDETSRTRRRLQQAALKRIKDIEEEEVRLKKLRKAEEEQAMEME